MTGFLMLFVLGYLFLTITDLIADLVRNIGGER